MRRSTVMGLYDFTFYDLVNRNAGCFKDKEAWLDIESNTVLTFTQFKEKVDQLATGLQRSGVKKGDRIGVLGKNSLEYLLLYGASAALGAIMLPINWRLSADEVGYNLNDGEPRLVVVEEEFQKTIEEVKERLPSVEQYFVIGAERENFSAFESLMEHGTDFEKPEVSTDDGFVIIHTAAVAGRPRGALLSHGNLLVGNMNLIYFLNLTRQDIHLSILPFFHVGGLFAAAASFHAGALTINMSKFDALTALKVIEDRQVTMLVEFPPILSSLLEEQEKTGIDIKSLRAVAGLDSPETIEKYQSVTGGSYYTVYAQTETSCFATLGAYDDKPGSAGRVVPLAEIRLVDDYDRLVPVGTVGEITMRGPMVFQGYWNLPEDTAYTFREGWHHTGDLGRFDEEGFLWYAGRKAEKELIKPGGENVYPAEVEKVIMQHPAVNKTVVFGVPDPKWGEGIKAVCQLKEAQTLEPQELIDFVGARIARYKKPQYVEFISDLPLLEDGSPDRDKVKKLYGGA
jgi:acyl-CoA synthetase (AMP-forming)/AMP-acid ligase II